MQIYLNGGTSSSTSAGNFCTWARFWKILFQTNPILKPPPPTPDFPSRPTTRMANCQRFQPSCHHEPTEVEFSDDMFSPSRFLTNTYLHNKL